MDQAFLLYPNFLLCVQPATFTGTAPPGSTVTNIIGSGVPVVPVPVPSPSPSPSPSPPSPVPVPVPVPAPVAPAVPIPPPSPPPVAPARAGAAAMPMRLARALSSAERHCRPVPDTHHVTCCSCISGTTDANSTVVACANSQSLASQSPCVPILHAGHRRIMLCLVEITISGGGCAMYRCKGAPTAATAPAATAPANHSWREVSQAHMRPEATVLPHQGGHISRKPYDILLGREAIAQHITYGSVWHRRARRVPKKCLLKAGMELLAYKTRSGAHLYRMSIGLHGVTGIALAAVYLCKLWAGISGLCNWRQFDLNKVASSVEDIADVIIALQWYSCACRRRYL